MSVTPGKNGFVYMSVNNTGSRFWLENQLYSPLATGQHKRSECGYFDTCSKQNKQKTKQQEKGREKKGIHTTGSEAQTKVLFLYNDKPQARVQCLFPYFISCITCTVCTCAFVPTTRTIYIERKFNKDLLPKRLNWILNFFYKEGEWKRACEGRELDPTTPEQRIFFLFELDPVPVCFFFQLVRKRYPLCSQVGSVWRD